MMPISDCVQSVTNGERRVGRWASHRNHSAQGGARQHCLHRVSRTTRFMRIVDGDTSTGAHAKCHASHQTPFLA